MTTPSVAIIGSFRKYYSVIMHHINIFRNNNIDVTTPSGSNIIEPNVEFVRFESDPTRLADEVIQTITLKKIFNSNAVYVVVPNGYIGRTTCYEIGRIIQRKQPLYFSDAPKDIPIKIPNSHIVSSEELSNFLIQGQATSLFDINNDDYSRLELNLFNIK